MSAYRITFHTRSHWADRTIRARSARTALAKARAALDAESLLLDWQAYDVDPGDVEAIEVSDEHGDATIWHSDDLSRRLAADEMFDALNALIAQIESLSGESSCIDEDIRQGEAYAAVRRALAMAKGGAP